MDPILLNLSQNARMFVQKRNWKNVSILANKIMALFENDAEGFFLLGLVFKASLKNKFACEYFEKALELDSKRYDAAIELANMYLIGLHHSDAFELLSQYESQLINSPIYLDMAGRVYSGLGLHLRAYPLFQKANELQPNIDMFNEHYASCSVLVGNISDAKGIYKLLIDKYPLHQKNHYELSNLSTATNASHVEQMQSIIKNGSQSHSKNIYLYYAIGKELEDLGRWNESFRYYKLAGQSVLASTSYDVAEEIKVIDKIKKTCSSNWLIRKNNVNGKCRDTTDPIFIVGLPRTGTTLTERVLSNHSQIESADETFFMQMVIREVAGQGGIGDVDESIIEKASKSEINEIARKYMSAIKYRLKGSPLFIDKYPFNYLYLGFIAKAFPNAKIIYLKRNPMDSCFAMFKQSFFKFAYSLNDLGQYYVAQNSLRLHWKEVLGKRLIEVEYESLVENLEGQTRQILESLGLKFEQNCMEFDKNPNSSASASTVQVREKVHTRSIHKWKRYSSELQDLKAYLVNQGIDLD